jgi:hypothetical protein
MVVMVLEALIKSRLRRMAGSRCGALVGATDNQVFTLQCGEPGGDAGVGEVRVSVDHVVLDATVPAVGADGVKRQPLQLAGVDTIGGIRRRLGATPAVQDVRIGAEYALGRRHRE